MNKIKKVSVIIPNYNYEEYISERIDSIINQTYPIYELIILDDCSTDNSVKIIEEKIKNIKNISIKFIKNRKNSNSVFSQWQLGLKNITGDYFWIAEADDLCDKEFLQESINIFEKNKNIILYYSNSKKIDENGKVFSEDVLDYMDIFNTGKWNNSYINDGRDEIVECLSNNNTILNVSSVVWKNSDIYMNIFEEAKNFKIAGDWYIYYKVLEHGDIAYNNKSLNYFRKHTDSVSSSVNINLEYKEVYQIQEEIKQKYKLSKAIIEKQIMRRKYMGFCEVKDNVDVNGSVAIICDEFNSNFKFKNIEKIIDEFSENGYKCDLYFEDSLDYNPLKIQNILLTNADIFTDTILNKKYSLIISTSKKNYDFVKKQNINKKIYLVNNIFKANSLKKEIENSIIIKNIKDMYEIDEKNIIFITKKWR